LARSIKDCVKSLPYVTITSASSNFSDSISSKKNRTVGNCSISGFRKESSIFTVNKTSIRSPFLSIHYAFCNSLNCSSTFSKRSEERRVGKDYNLQRDIVRL